MSSTYGTPVARNHTSQQTKRLSGFQLTIIWRRGSDSNPRYPCEYAAFRVRCFQPLIHLSGARNGPEKPRMDGRYVTKRAKTDKGARRILRPLQWTRPQPGEAMQNALKFDRIRRELPGVAMTLGLVAV